MERFKPSNRDFTTQVLHNNKAIKQGKTSFEVTVKHTDKQVAEASRLNEERK